MPEIGKLSVKLQLSAKEFSRSIDRNRREMKRWKTDMTSMVASGKTALKGLTVSLAAVTAATGAATAAISAMMVKTTKAFAAFEHEGRKVATMVKENWAETMQALSAGVRQLSLDIPHTTTKLNAALYDVLSASVPVSQSLYVLGEAGEAATAGFSSVTTAGNLATGTANALGIAFTDVDKIFDKAFSAVREGKFTFEELAGSLGQVLPSAKKMKSSIDEVYGSIAFLTKNAMSADMASVSLARALDALGEKSDKLKDMGIKVFGREGQYLGILKIVEQIHDQLRGLTQEAKVNVFSEMGFDVRAARAIVLMSENLEGFRQTMSDVSDSAGATKEAFEKMKDTLVNQWRLLGNATKNLSIIIGSQFEDAAKSSLESLTDFVNKVSELIEVGGGFSKLWQNHGDMVIAIFADVARTGVKLMGEMFGAIGDIARISAEKLYVELEMISRQAIGTPGEYFSKFIETSLKEGIDKVPGAFTELQRTMDEELAEALSAFDWEARFGQAFTKRIESITTTASSSMSAAMKNLDASIAELKGTGKAAEGLKTIGDEAGKATMPVSDLGKVTGGLAGSVSSLNTNLVTGTTALSTWTAKMKEAMGFLRPEGPIWKPGGELGETGAPWANMRQLQENMQTYQDAFAKADEAAKAKALQTIGETLEAELDANQVKQRMLQAWLDYEGKQNDEREEAYLKSVDAKIDAEYEFAQESRKNLAFVVDYNAKAVQQLKDTWQELVDDWPDPVPEMKRSFDDFLWDARRFTDSMSGITDLLFGRVADMQLGWSDQIIATREKSGQKELTDEEKRRKEEISILEDFYQENRDQTDRYKEQVEKDYKELSGLYKKYGMDLTYLSKWREDNIRNIERESLYDRIGGVMDWSRKTVQFVTDVKDAYEALTSTLKTVNTWLQKAVTWIPERQTTTIPIPAGQTQAEGYGPAFPEAPATAGGTALAGFAQAGVVAGTVYMGSEIYKGQKAKQHYMNEATLALLTATQSDQQIKSFLKDWKSTYGAESLSGLSTDTWEKYGIDELAKGGIITRPTVALMGEGSKPEAVIPLTKPVEVFITGTRIPLPVVLQSLLSGQAQQVKQLKQFAKGGLVDKPTTALLGEGSKPEAVVPLQNMRIPVEFLNRDSGTQQLIAEVQMLRQQLTQPRVMPAMQQTRPAAISRGVNIEKLEVNNEMSAQFPNMDPSTLTQEQFNVRYGTKILNCVQQLISTGRVSRGIA